MRFWTSARKRRLAKQFLRMFNTFFVLSATLWVYGAARALWARVGGSGGGDRALAEAEGVPIFASFTEVETGKGSDALERRPQLRAALEEARSRRAAVCVAKLDRLSRDVHFISGLMAQRVPFIVAELGTDTAPFLLHLYAALAEKERSLISGADACCAGRAKERGAQLGDPNLHARPAVKAARARSHGEAVQRARSQRCKDGYRSLHSVRSVR
jgi:DNA invertase Pin-like site-specific DNA recombinase